MRDLILMILGFVLAIVGAIIGAVLDRKLYQNRQKRPLNQLLNFGSDELLFVYPPRDEFPAAFPAAKAILPRTATEDFIAVNNFITALIAIGWKTKFKVRDTRRITTNDLKKNLVLICSPKSNSLTKKIQELLLQAGVDFYHFVKDPVKPEEWRVEDMNGAWPSESFATIAANEALPSGQRRAVADLVLHDIATITKITNPWNDSNKIIIVAGVRGIGTWGAAECIKKRWQRIYKKLPVKNKGSDFSALVRIGYDNCDIDTIEPIQEVKLIDPAKLEQLANANLEDLARSVREEAK